VADDEDTSRTIDRTDTESRPRTDDQTTGRIAHRPFENTAVERPEEPTTTPAPRWVRVSAMATLGLILGVVALATTMTGLLAPVGVAVGVLGGAISAGGLVGASRRGVTGHSVALLGLLASIAAIVLGVLAVAGYLPWLDSKTDEVARARDWLNAHVTWFKNW
jgi:hypothetical protein